MVAGAATSAAFSMMDTAAAGGDIGQALLSGVISFGSGMIGAAMGVAASKIGDAAGKFGQVAFSYVSGLGIAYGIGALTGSVNKENWDTMLLSYSVNFAVSTAVSAVGREIESVGGRQGSESGANATQEGGIARRLPGEVAPEDIPTQSSMPNENQTLSQGWSQQGVESLMTGKWSGVIKDVQQRGWEIRSASSITEQADVLTNNPNTGWSYDSAEMNTGIVGLAVPDEIIIYLYAGLSNEDAASTIVHEWTHVRGYGEDTAYRVEMMFQKDIGISQTFSSESAIKGHIQSNYIDPYNGFTRLGSDTFYRLREDSFIVHNSWTVWGAR